MDIKASIAAVKAKIPPGVTLVAVSKMQPPEALQAALDAGLRVFGENRVQEAQEHWETLKDQYPDLRLHLIGGLQTNKADDAVALFDVIETVDREKLVDALAEAMDKQGHSLPCLIQVNTGREEQKGGVMPEALDMLFRYAIDKGLDITGLMCIPPVEDDPAPHFKMLAEMARKLGLKMVSMGMSADFQVAIAHGATHVRVGSALFGERAPR